MPDIETIAHVDDLSVVRVLIAALRAHGFHPIEGGQDGLPGLPGALSPSGIAIRVPQDEARDARPLAEALLADMGR
ncbi:MAG TPA: hypothetical protein VIL84_01475 [Devosiaceae bacterium]